MSDSMVLLLGNSLAALLRFVALWYVARTLGAPTQGSVSVALAMLSFAGSILSGGFDYAAAWLAGRRATSPSTLYRSAAIVTAVSLVAAPLWVLGFQWFVPAILPDRDIRLWPMLALILLIPSAVSILVLQGVLIGMQQFRAVVKGSLIGSLCWIILLLLPITKDAGYLGVLVALLFANSAQLAYMSRSISLTPYDNTSNETSVRKAMHLLLGYGAKTIPGTFARALNIRLGLYASSAILTPTEIGVYALVLSIGDAYLQLPTALGQVILGRTARDGMEKGFPTSLLGLLFGLGMLCALVAWAVGPEILRYTIGPSYAPSRVVLTAIALGVTAHSLALLQAHALLGDGQPGVVSKAQWLALFAHGIAISLLGHRYGMSGLAVAMLIGFFVYATAVLLFAGSKDVIRLK